MTVTREPLVPGTVSSRRPVPAHIPRPEHVVKPAPQRVVGSAIKRPATILRMRLAGRIAAPALPADVIQRTQQKYLAALRNLLG